MKKINYVFALMISMAFSCNNNAQSDAAKTMNSIKEAQAKYSPGMVPTTADGYTMTAKIDGKAWAAEAMYPPSVANRIVGSKGKENIGMPYWSLNYKVGQIRKFQEGNAVDVYMDDEVGIWGAYNGQSEITKVGDKWVEGTFYFTATTREDASKSLKVTDGFFRIPVEQ